MPLHLQRGGTNNQHGARAMARNQFLRDKSRLNRLAHTHIIGNQQTHARHLHRAHERIELIILNFDAAAKWRLQRAVIRRRNCAPADGIQKRVKARGRIKPVERGQANFFIYARVRLDFPDHLERFAERVVFNRTQRDEMLWGGLTYSVQAEKAEGSLS